ncbi:MAG: DUF2520 domain-containing protein [Bacteroidaceae bacterium]|nr:DUF2520 domain-containing protein [Bacteroidaceae bacterium]
MRLTLIGKGNLGTNLHAALEHAGHEVTWLQGRSFATEGAKGDIIIVAVKDDAIPSVTSRLSTLDKLVVHTSGSVPMQAIPCRRRGVFYPMQTFSKERIVDFRPIPIFLESDTDMPLLEQLAQSISNSIYRLDSERRRWLHLAAVFACNFANHCYTLSAEVLQQAGLPFEVMLPLIDETTAKVHSMSPQSAQTGPAIRYDENVIGRHEQMLDGTTRDIYHLMSKSIHDKLRPKED